MSEHQADLIDGFPERYGVHTLVYAEFHATMAEAILREKRIKTWRRAWKIALIEKSNPVKSNPVKSNPVKSNPVKSNPVKSNPVKSNPVWRDLSDEIG